MKGKSRKSTQHHGQTRPATRGKANGGAGSAGSTRASSDAFDMSRRDSVACDAAKLMYVQLAGGKACRKLAAFAFNDSTGDVADMFIASLTASINPRDAIEEMLVVQIAVAHMRLIRLSVLAADQNLRENVKVINDACDHAANTLRRLMLTLEEYRRPAKVKVFAPIKNANVAQQQLVQVQQSLAESSDGKTSNEQGLLPEAAATLPPVGGWAGIVARGGPPQPAVAEEHRAEDAGGTREVQPERVQARPAAGASAGPAA